MSDTSATWAGLQSPQALAEPSHEWKLCAFRPSSAIEVSLDGSRLLREAFPSEADSPVLAEGWDHEHCEGCWTTISANAQDINETYTDGKLWVCPQCFKKYIEPLVNESGSEPGV